MSRSFFVPTAVALAISGAVPAYAAKYEVLYAFKGGTTDGSNVPAGLLRVGGLLYGSTYGGGANGQGTVFSITPAGAETVLYSFKGGSDAAHPWATLINVDGTLYGTSSGGGTESVGTIFKISTAGIETVMYSFKGGPNGTEIDGANPMAGLVRVGGTLYGTAAGGGIYPYWGALFKITLGGAYKDTYNFNPPPDAVGPVAALIHVGSKLYGTTFEGGQYQSGFGAMFEISTDDKYKFLYSFGGGTDGADPGDSLLDVGGTFYGTTESGGTSELGTVFKITPAGAETVLYNFSGAGKDGGGPSAGLINVNGTFYGVTGAGYDKNGAFSGTLFSITPAGVKTVLHIFGKNGDGIAPLGDLIKVGNALYGTTWSGGANGDGLVFKYKL
jgi:uncharacterized repeat protein (TIGR03803 family)